MKRSTILIGACGILFVALPVIVLAQYTPPISSPPVGNVPGVIWNANDKAFTGQPGAAINIGGYANTGPLTVSGVANITGTANVQNVNTSGSGNNNLFGDNFLIDGSNFKIVPDPTKSAPPLTKNLSYNFGNFTSLPAGPFTLNTTGGLKILPISLSPASVLGSDGRVQASKFCFNPGTGASDCISSWGAVGGGGSGLTGVTPGTGIKIDNSVPAKPKVSLDTVYTDNAYVGKGGDTMTGLLINTSGSNFFGNWILGSKGGLWAEGDGSATNPAGFDFSTAVVGDSANVGGDFTGSQVGLKGYALRNGNFYNGVTGVTTHYAGTGATITGGALGLDVSGPAAGATEGTAIHVANANVGIDANGTSYGIQSHTTGGNGIGGQFQGLRCGGAFSNQVAPGGPVTNVDCPADPTLPVSTSNPRYGMYTNTAVKVDNELDLTTNKGVVMDAQDSPLITRGWDQFDPTVRNCVSADPTRNGMECTSNAVCGAGGTCSFPPVAARYAGLGRWGLFMEPGKMTLGIPDISNRSFSVVAYQPDGSYKDLLDVSSNGNVNILGTVTAKDFIKTPSAATVNCGDYGIPTGLASPQCYYAGSSPAKSSWSDARLKDIHGDFTRGLDDLLKVNAIDFNYKKDNPFQLPSDENHVGVVAQSVQKAIPEAVSTSTGGYLQVDYTPIVMTMLNSIKELKTENDQLKARLDTLEAAQSK